ncbi:MAG: hypothetical protein ACJ751_11460 [Niastella sp.]|uniref:hypothetical protein n=1 Tax=Niastella sp. TaxID=1869183 RepID=UPI00389A27B8
MEQLLNKITKEFFGKEFTCKIFSNGITLAAKDNSKAFYIGLISDSCSFRVRENIYVIKRFQEVETILQPLLKKNKLKQGDAEMKVYGVDFKGTIKKAMPMKNIAAVDASFIENMTDIDDENESQIRQVLTGFKKAIEYLEDEFINRYNTLQQVYKALEQMTPDEQGKFLLTPAPIRFLAIEALCNPTRDLDSIFESTLNGYEEVDKELPGMFKDQYLVTLELLRYFREQKQGLNHK